MVPAAPDCGYAMPPGTLLSLHSTRLPAPVAGSENTVHLMRTCFSVTAVTSGALYVLHEAQQALQTVPEISAVPLRQRAQAHGFKLSQRLEAVTGSINRIFEV